MIIQNAFYVPEIDKYFVSTHRHDFTGHVFPDGKEYFTDGGKEYVRRVGDLVDLIADGRVVDFTIESKDGSFTEQMAEKLLWGTRGKDGKQPLTYRLMKDLDVDYLKELVSYIPEKQVRKTCALYWHNIKSQK